MNWYDVGIVMSRIGLVMVGAGLMMGVLITALAFFLND
jgi:hypothetical protein